MPGAAIRVARVVKTDIRARMAAGRELPASLDAIEGTREILCCKHVRTPMAPGDVWYHSWQAGGGYGDPLTRDPDTVAIDVARDVVSAEAAREIYGVVLAPDGRLDAAATTAARQALRKERLGRATVPEPTGPFVLAGKGKHRYGDALHADFVRNEVACGHCGHVLGAGGQDLYPQLREFTSALSAAGARARRGLRYRPLPVASPVLQPVRRPCGCAGRARWRPPGRHAHGFQLSIDPARRQRRVPHAAAL